MAQLIHTKHGYCFIGDNVDSHLWLVYPTLDKARKDAEKYHVKFEEKL
jgi:hypothetical protein